MTHTDLADEFQLWVEDELPLMAACVPLKGARVLDLGCGAAGMTRRIATEGGAAHVTGAEVDEQQLAKNLAGAGPENVSFERCGAEQLPFPDGTFDGISMFKSLHHVPVQSLDAAFGELRRVLKPGGWLFISEPVYAGPFNDVVRLFHDEGHVREQALQATDRAVRSGLFDLERRLVFQTPVSFRDFPDFQKRLMNVTHSEFGLTPELVSKVERAFNAHLSPRGANFVRPMRVDVLQRAWPLCLPPI